MEWSVENCYGIVSTRKLLQMVSRKLLWNGQLETAVEWSVGNCCGIVSRKLLWNGQ